MEEPLVPPGNALRPRALWYLLLGFGALVVLLASDAHSRFSVPLGLLATLVAGFGALDFAGAFNDAPGDHDRQVSLTALRPRLLEAAGTCVLWVLVLRLAVAGVLPQHALLAPLVVTLASCAALLALARVVAAWAPANVRLRDRAGLWLLLLGTLLYVPFAGSYSLLDPWETHYGEVAREMLARDDWLSFWWAQEGWFWSKPPLDFWLQGLFFALLGVRFEPDQMLAAAAQHRLPQPEWAARLPIVLLALLAVYALYRVVAAAAGRRAGFLAGLVLLCMPYWSLLGHQSMTDMPYVAALTVAVACFGLGLLADPDERAKNIELTAFGRTLRLSGVHVLFGLVLLSSLPQLAYLVTRNVTLQIAAPPYGFRWHWDEFFSGSGLGNCGLPGNDACRGLAPQRPLFQPLLGAAIWSAALGYLLYVNRGERRKKRLFYLAGWFFTSLSVLGKGAPGLVLPVIIVAAALVARRQWRELTRIELASAGLLLAAVALPWYVQAYMRHGEGFTDRLLFHDMYKRAFVHVHDTNAGTDVSLRYYVWQLGYGLFPWTGLALGGIGVALERGSARQSEHRELGSLVTLWLTLAFALFTASLTKFHHYALPCTPPLAVGVGLLLDRALGDGSLPRGTRRPVHLALLTIAALLLVYGATRWSDGAVFGSASLNASLPSAAPLTGGLVFGLGLLLVGLAAWLAPTPRSATSDASLSVLALLAGLVVLLVARDLSTSLTGDVPGSARLLHLVTYNYKRSWPPTLDFEAVQWGFGVATALACLLLAMPRLRFHAGVLTCAIGVWFCAFTLWVYLPRVAPHFGQRELLLAYYQARRSAQEPIVAYQMNWKGENFYTGNRIAAFVSTGAKFQKWLKAQRKAGTKVMYFLTEHGRLGTLKSELGPGFATLALTDKRLNNKFGLVRVELVAEPKTETHEAAD